jgi:hypothetical protein
MQSPEVALEVVTYGKLIDYFIFTLATLHIFILNSFENANYPISKIESVQEQVTGKHQ